jgi:peptidoglycan/xylan/chitin deacetylase (PgdA/CDA1 family)
MSRPLVLCYHAVSDGWGHALALRPAAFERQVRSLLDRGFQPVDASEAISGSGRLLHVTFDDAYTSIAGALDLLERLGVPATIFAATAFADGGRPLDVPELAEDAIAHPDELETMDWAELRALADRGFEIGSHTVSHPHLPRLGEAEIDRELRESRVRCEDQLGRPCRYLAYPYGEHDERARALAERAGYDAAFTLHGTREPPGRYSIRRAHVYRSDSLLRATLKTSFVARPSYRAAALVRAALRR